LKFNRMFWDIETSQAVLKSWRSGYKLNIGADRIVKHAAIICICWKWEGKDKVYSLTWKDGCDKELLEKFIVELNKADEAIAHNGDKFDLKWVTGRCVYHMIEAFPEYKTVDTLKLARRHKFPSNKLDELGQYLGIGEKVKHRGIAMWDECEAGSKKALKEMVDYCKGDIVLLEKFYQRISMYSKPTTHIGSYKLRDKFDCAHCGSENVVSYSNKFSAAGTRKKQMRCNDCKRYYTVAWNVYMKYEEYKRGL